MASPLENLSGPGKPLREEPPDEKEYSGLKRSALARLADSAKNSNSLESRFDSPTTPRMHFAWPPCAGMVIGRPIVTSSFRYCRTRSAWVRKCGECSINVIPFVISENTREISI